MIKHHPDINLLTEYASGTLDWALSIAVATHLHFCKECQSHLHTLNGLGGELLSQIPTAKVDDSLLESLLGKLDDVEPNPHCTLEHSPKLGASEEILKDIPPVVEKLLPTDHKLKWSFASPSLKMARLKTGQEKYEVAFHKICAGGKVAEHDHKGLEITIVLKGCFSDSKGIYNPGDFIAKKPGETHRPIAAQNQECLCFSISEAPVHLTGFMGKVVNPFLGFRPS